MLSKPIIILIHLVTWEVGATGRGWKWTYAYVLYYLMLYTYGILYIPMLYTINYLAMLVSDKTNFQVVFELHN